MLIGTAAPADEAARFHMLAAGSLELLEPTTLSSGEFLLDPGADRAALRPQRFERRPHRSPAVLPAARYRLPGEFEHQSALMIGCHEMVPEMPELFADMVEALRGRVELVALVNDADEAEDAQRVLAARYLEVPDVQYLELPHSTMWARDYGPMVVVAEDGSLAAVDASYGQIERNDDDQVPPVLARHLRLPVLHTQLVIQGGNLLSNGHGLCIATWSLLDDNTNVANENAIREELARLYGAGELVLLERLAGEPTGHVDMFATFTSPSSVVVGSYDIEVDAENAAILDRNAALLEQVATPWGPLRVTRIPMPPREDGVWRTYTNVVYANNAVLVPVYPGEHAAAERQALQTYSRLLSGWSVVGIDAREICLLDGALHCVTMNLGPIPAVPRFPAPRARGRGQSWAAEPRLEGVWDLRRFADAAD